MLKGHVSSDNSIFKSELKIKLAISGLFLILISIKIKGGHEFAKGVKLKGPKVLFLNLGAQNRKFVKLGGPKVHFSQNGIVLKKPHQLIQSKPHRFGLVWIVFLKSPEPNQTACFFILWL